METFESCVLSQKAKAFGLLFFVFVSVSMVVWNRMNLAPEHEVEVYKLNEEVLRLEQMPRKIYGSDSFGGLGTTMIDSLDTLYIMGPDEQFQKARKWMSSGERKQIVIHKVVSCSRVQGLR